MKKTKWPLMLAAWLLLSSLRHPAAAAVSPLPGGASREICFAITEGLHSAEEAAFQAAYKEDPAVIAYIEKMKNDPLVQQAVQEEAPSPEGWWRWIESLPVETAHYMSQKNALEWLEQYMTVPKEERGYFSYNLLRPDFSELAGQPEGSQPTGPASQG